MIRVIQNTTSRLNYYMDGMVGKTFIEYEKYETGGYAKAYYKIKDEDGYEWNFLARDIEELEQSEDDLFKRRLLD